MAKLSFTEVQGNSFRIQITDIEESLYGAEIRLIFDEAKAEGGVSLALALGKLGTSSTWTSEQITSYYYYDDATGNEEKYYLEAALEYSVQCYAWPVDGGSYLIGADSVYLPPSDAGRRPRISSFSIAQTKTGEKKATIYYKLRNVYDGEDDESFRTNIYAYVNGKRKTGIAPIGKDEEGSFVIAFDDFGTYEVYIVAQNISWTAKDDYLYYSDPSETITITIRDAASIGDCKIEYEVIGRKYYDGADGVEAYVDDYIKITSEAWTRFCDAINAVRTAVGLSEATFTSGDTLSAIMWNEAMEAVAGVGDVVISYFDAEKFMEEFSALRGAPITKTLIDEVNSEIAAILEEIT